MDTVDGDLFVGTLDTNKIINMYYGYEHTVTIKYFDKYTNEPISEDYLTIVKRQSNVVKVFCGTAARFLDILSKQNIMK